MGRAFLNLWANIEMAPHCSHSHSSNKVINIKLSINKQAENAEYYIFSYYYDIEWSDVIA